MTYVNTVEQVSDKLMAATDSANCSAMSALLHQVCQSLQESDASFLRHWYNSRLTRACENPMLGEKAVTIFADLLGITVETAQCVEKPWMLLYIHALLLDDMIDYIPREESKKVQSLCSAFDREHNKVCELLLNENFVVYSHHHQRFNAEAWAAITYEIEWSKGTRFTSHNEAPRQQGLKAALAKSCATMLMLAERGIPLSSEQEEGIITLCEGIQLLDDFADMTEDYMQGRMNRLLNTTYRWIRRNLPCIDIAYLGKYQLLVSAILSSAITCTWIDAANRYEQTLQIFKPSSECWTAQYFLQQSVECRLCSTALTDLLTQNRCLLDQLITALSVNEEELACKLTTGCLAGLWQDIRYIIGTGPKASN